MIDIEFLAHIGIRVADEDRAVAFYRHLGFEFVWKSEEHPVVVLRNPTGIEINLIVNANDGNDGRNVLMDVDAKYPGYTHMALQVASLAAAMKALEEAGIPLSSGPDKLGRATAVFIRDPDRNVIELREPYR